MHGIKVAVDEDARISIQNKTRRPDLFQSAALSVVLKDADYHEGIRAPLNSSLMKALMLSSW